MRPVERGAWRAHSQLPCRAILMCEQIISILLAKGQAAAAPSAALLFLTHKSTGPNKNVYCQNLGSRLGNFNKAPELVMKYPQLSSGEGKKH